MSSQTPERMRSGVLVDIPKCIGCGSCTVACKLWNDRDFDASRPAQSDDPQLTDQNWTTLRRNRVKCGDTTVVRYTKRQCLHCLEPACEAVCFSKAIQVIDGAVVYNPKLCVGCRYCMLACPFDVPTYEWSKVLPSVTKCQMCHSRLANGDLPACVGVCPTQALSFGNRDELLDRARGIIRRNPAYIDHIYGEHEAGGTQWLYISDVPFDQLGFKTDVTTAPLPSYLASFNQWVPHLFIGGAAAMAALSFVARFRERRTQTADPEP